VRTETTGALAKGALTLKDWARSLVNRAKIAGKDREEAKERAIAAQLTPSVQERQQDLIQFYSRYEDLVEVLCDAAQIGPSAKLEAAYAEHKKWMDAHYASIRRYVVAYLRFTSEDAQQSLIHGGRSADAFEALVAAPNLEEFLKNDDGQMISRITRTREALNLYGEHLRQLLVRG
jgi:hypothetical protein